MLGRVLVWAANSAQAHGQSFNVDNGDVWEWKTLWNSLAYYYNIPLAEKDSSFKFEQFFKDHEDVWSEIVQQYGLRKLTLNELLGQSAQCLDIQFSNCSPEKMLGGGKPWIESR
jgi:hypothetical protein